MYIFTDVDEIVCVVKHCSVGLFSLFAALASGKGEPGGGSERKDLIV